MMKTKRMFFLTALCVAAAMCFTAVGGCKSDDGSVPSAPTEPVETTYDAPAVKKNYAPIDDSLYRSYYFSSDGDDANSGLNEESPKRSLSAAADLIREVTEENPTKILFKAGSNYKGNLKIDGFSAAEATPLIVSSYGVTDENKYVKIEGNDWSNCCIELNRGNARISGFEVTAPRGYRGIWVQPNRSGAVKNIVISDNYCHDINFDLGDKTIPEDGSIFTPSESEEVCSSFSYDRGGIIFEVYNGVKKGPAWFENVWIENNRIANVARCGIWVFSSWVRRAGIDWGYNHYYDDDTNWFHHSDFYITGNTVDYSGGDAIILGATVGGVVEHNVSRHAHFLNIASASAGIWLHSCKNVVMQYNEASYTHTRYDGQGFDIDIGCSNILFQYNYAHHNEGGGLLMCNTKRELPKFDKDGNYVLDEDGLPIVEMATGPWHDVIVRNNVFADNREADLIFSGTVSDIIVDNNTFIKSGTGGEYDIKIFDTKDFGGVVPGDRWNVANNIFYIRNANAPADFNMSYSTRDKESGYVGYTFENNIYYGFGDEFMSDVVGDVLGEKKPLVLNPGDWKNNVAGDGLESAYAFMPDNSAVLNSGIARALMLNADYAGNKVAEKVNYIGAFCKTK